MDMEKSVDYEMSQRFCLPVIYRVFGLSSQFIEVKA